MAEPNFRRSPKTGATPVTTGNVPNFARTVDGAKPKVTVDSLEVDATVPSQEEAIARTHDTMLADGVDPRVANSMVLPQDSGVDTVFPKSLQSIVKMTQHVAPIAKIAATEDTLKISQQQAADQAPLDTHQFGLMQSILSIMEEKNVNEGGKALGMMAETRSWWKKLQRHIGKETVETVSQGWPEFQLGLSLLDDISWATKKFRLQFVPGGLFVPGTEKQKAARRDLEARVLPKITLDNGKQYSTGTSAAIDIILNRMMGVGEQFVGNAMKSGVVPGGAVAGQNLVTKGQTKEDQAYGQIPTLVAAIGPNLSWQEVVERNWEQVADLDKFYAGLNDKGLYGQMAMAGIALGDGLAELSFDPFLAIGGVGAELSKVLREAAMMGEGHSALKSAARVGRHAGAMAEAARRTYKFEDVVDSVKAANEALATTQMEAEAMAKRSGYMSADMTKKVIAKRKAVLVEEDFLDQFKDAGPYEPILLRTARRTPETLPDLSTTQEYVGPPQVVGQGPVTPSSMERNTPAFTEVENLKTLRKAMGPKTTVETAKVDARIKDIEAKIAKETPEFLLMDEAPRPGVPVKVPREITDIASEIHAERLASLERQADMSTDFGQTDNLPLFQQRQLLGPDDAEQVGDGLNHMVHSGGTGIDDITLTPSAPEVSLIPQSQMGLVDWRRVDAANRTVAAEREFETVKQQYTLYDSSRRSLAREVQVTRKNLGLLRQQMGLVKGTPAESYVKGKIAFFENELVNSKKLMKTLPKEPKKPFDEGWLPGVQKSIMQDPERYHNWLGKAGNRVFKSLYPGGLFLNAGEGTVGQLIAPLRQPLRFLQTYDPAAGERLRSGFLRMQQHQQVFFNKCTDAALEAGVITKRAKFDFRKDYSPYVINKPRNQLLFDLLDTPVGGFNKFLNKHWDELVSEADASLLKAHATIRKELELMAEKQGVTDTDKFISGYIRHALDRSQFAGGARPMEYVGLPTDPEVFASHLLDRTGKAGYPRDAMLALDMYGRAASRKLILEPLYDDMIRTGGELATKHSNSFFQTYMNDLVHQMKGKPQFVGRKIDEAIGGPFLKDGTRRWVPSTIDRAVSGIGSLFYMGSLGGNPRQPLMQVSTGLVTTTGRFGLFRTSKAVWQMASREGQHINEEVGTVKAFEDIFESNFWRKATKVVFNRVGVPPMKMVEEGTRGVTAHAAIDMYMTKMGFTSWEEAKAAGYSGRIAFEALRSAEECNGAWGPIHRSGWASRTLAPSSGTAALLTQFLSFPLQQSEELLAQANHNPGKILQYFAISGWLSRIAAQELGLDETDYVGLGYLPKAPDDMTSPAVDAFIKLMDMTSAMSRRNPKDVSDTTRAFLASTQSLIPLINAMEASGRSAERVSTGAQKTINGEKVRTLDFSTVLPPPTPGVDLRLAGASQLQNAIQNDPASLGAAIRPSADSERAKNDKLAGLGGDIIPTLFGQRSIRDAVVKQGLDAKRREGERFAFNFSSTMDEYVDALMSHDVAKQEKLVNELGDTYKYRFQSLDEPLAREIEARQVSEVMRGITQNEILLDRFVQVYNNYGLEIAP